ncbi:MAG: 16S rRNA (guanine(966)-N(2))-methyltransferase RsmD [Clostridiales bacterium]|nr:16S rRNA (guanine(966)-N(2))-methyltransferase RsmD [Clostridiales bacterium]
MRVITGSARGMNLDTLAGEDVTRPTAAVVKEAIFSSIQFELEGRTMLDLYAGCGQMGIEALSRGAEKAPFVDSSRDAINVITSNLKKTKLYQKSNVLCMDVGKYLESARGRYEFDYVFIDPPYAARALPKTLAALYDAGLLKPTSLIICEDDKHLECDDVMISDRYELVKKTNYGRVSVTYFKPKGLEDD